MQAQQSGRLGSLECRRTLRASNGLYPRREVRTGGQGEKVCVPEEKVSSWNLTCARGVSLIAGQEDKEINQLVQGLYVAIVTVVSLIVGSMGLACRRGLQCLRRWVQEVTADQALHSEVKHYDNHKAERLPSIEKVGEHQGAGERGSLPKRQSDRCRRKRRGDGNCLWRAVGHRQWRSLKRRVGQAASEQRWRFSEREWQEFQRAMAPRQWCTHAALRFLAMELEITLEIYEPVNASSSWQQSYVIDGSRPGERQVVALAFAGHHYDRLGDRLRGRASSYKQIKKSEEGGGVNPNPSNGWEEHAASRRMKNACPEEQKTANGQGKKKMRSHKQDKKVKALEVAPVRPHPLLRWVLRGCGVAMLLLLWACAAGCHAAPIRPPNHSQSWKATGIEEEKLRTHFLATAPLPKSPAVQLPISTENFE